jgi:hypothetical protein
MRRLICADYPEDTQPLVLYHSGRVQRFPSIAKAKAMLMDYSGVICNERELIAYRHLNPIDFDRRFQSYEVLDEEIWAYMCGISEWCDPWSKSETDTDEVKMTKRVTGGGYYYDKGKGIAFQQTAKAPAQAKALVSILQTFKDDGRAITDEDMERALFDARRSGLIKTKQNPMRIFTYYRKMLMDHGVIKLRR